MSRLGNCPGNQTTQGFDWWLIQDYYTASNGLLDSFLTPKPGIRDSVATMQSVLNQTVLLMKAPPHDRGVVSLLPPAFRGGQALVATLGVSSFGAGAREGSSVRWRVTVADKVLVGSSIPVSGMPLGEVTWLPIPVNVTFPQVLGTFPSGGRSATSAAPIVLAAELVATDGRVLAQNQWTSTLFPSFKDGPSSDLSLTLWSLAALMDACMFDDCKELPASSFAGNVPATNTTHQNVVLLTGQQIPLPAIELVQAGASIVFCMNSSTEFFPSIQNNFKSAWWLGTSLDNNAGTLVYTESPVVANLTAGMLGVENASFLDVTWHRLIDGARSIDLDKLPAQPEVLIRALDIAGTGPRRKALLARFAAGKGTVYVTGLNILQNFVSQTPTDYYPDKAWLLFNLIRYASAAGPVPKERLPLEAQASCECVFGICTAPINCTINSGSFDSAAAAEIAALKAENAELRRKAMLKLDDESTTETQLKSTTATASVRAAFIGSYYDGISDTPAGAEYIQLLDQARRMLAPADPQAELTTLTGVYGADDHGLTEGSQWAGNFWTQNSYGFTYSAAAILPQPITQWLQTSFNWFFDHAGDGGQLFDGLADVPAGMLCDDAGPGHCDYKQCGPNRKAKMAKRLGAGAATADTPGPGHDWVIEGSLSAVIAQAELLLATRNISAIKTFLPQAKQLADFLETRRRQLDGAATGLFLANRGANLLAPSYGGQGLPRGCIVNASCGTAGFPVCCSNRGMAMLTGLTITYSAMLDRVIALEELAYPAGRHCTTPRPNTGNISSCVELYAARRAANDISLKSGAVTARMPGSNSSYFIKALAPDGERQGVITDATELKRDCLGDSRGWLNSSFVCGPATLRGYFETSPNVDAIALGVVDDATAAELYSSIQAVKGLRPCGWTISNFPDYDDSGYGKGEECRARVGCFGWFVSGVTCALGICVPTFDGCYVAWRLTLLACVMVVLVVVCLLVYRRDAGSAGSAGTLATTALRFGRRVDEAIPCLYTALQERQPSARDGLRAG
eukprot:SAG22_NODE_24_length_30194_cov_6.086327_11_plen_1024_part_00